MASTSSSSSSMSQRIAQLCQKDQPELSAGDVFDVLKHIVDEVASTAAASVDCLANEQLILATRIVGSKTNHIGPCLFKVNDLLCTALENINNNNSSNSSAGGTGSKNANNVVNFNKARCIALMELLSAILDSASIADVGPFVDNVLNTACRKKGKAPAWFPLNPKAATFLKGDDALLQAAVSLFARYVSHPAHFHNQQSGSASSSSSSSSSSCLPSSTAALFARTVSRSANGSHLMMINSGGGAAGKEPSPGSTASTTLDTIEIKAIAAVHKHVTESAGTASFSPNLSTALFNVLLLLARSPRPAGKEFAKWLHTTFFGGVSSTASSIMSAVGGGSGSGGHNAVAAAATESFLRWIEMAGRGDAKLCGEIVEYCVRICVGMGGPVVSDQSTLSSSSSSSPKTNNNNNNNNSSETQVLSLLLDQAHNFQVPMQQQHVSATTSSTPLFLRSVYIQAAACQLWQLFETNFSDNASGASASTSGAASPSSSSSSSSAAAGGSAPALRSYTSLRQILMLCLGHQIGAAPSEQVQLLPGLQALELVCGALNCDGKLCSVIALLVSLLDNNNSNSSSSKALRQLAADNCGLSNVEDLGPASLASSGGGGSGSNLRGAIIYAVQRAVARLATVTDSTTNLVLSAVKFVLLPQQSESTPHSRSHHHHHHHDDKSHGSSSEKHHQHHHHHHHHHSDIQQQQQQGHVPHTSPAPPSELEARAASLLLLELSCRLPRPFPVVGQPYWTEALGILSIFFAPSSSSNSNASADAAGEGKMPASVFVSPPSTPVFGAPAATGAGVGVGGGGGFSPNSMTSIIAVSRRIASVASAIRCYSTGGGTGEFMSSSSAAASGGAAGDDGDGSSFGAIISGGNEDGSSSTRKQVVRVFLDAVAHHAYLTLRHVTAPLASGIPAAALAAALAYRTGSSSGSSGGGATSAAAAAKSEEEDHKQQQQQSGVSQWWDQAIEFLMLAGAPPSAARGVVASKPAGASNQPLSMSTMRACLCIIHESWQAKYRAFKKRQLQLSNNNNNNNTACGSNNRNDNAEGAAVGIVRTPNSPSPQRAEDLAASVFFAGGSTTTTWVTALANLIADPKVPISVRGDCLGMFARLPPAHIAVHFRSLLDPLATVLFSSYVCSSAVVQELGDDALLAHSSCWSVLPMCCAAVRVDGFLAVQREVARMTHVRGLVASQGFDAQHQLVGAAILTFARVAKFLPSFFRDIVTVHFDVFAKMSGHASTTAGSAAPAAGAMSGGAAAQQQHPLASLVNRSTVLLNTLASLCRTIRGYCAAINNRAVASPDRPSINLLLDQFLGKNPSPLLAPATLSQSADLATCILSARCCALLATTTRAITATTTTTTTTATTGGGGGVGASYSGGSQQQADSSAAACRLITQPHVPHLMMSLVLRECAKAVVASRRRRYSHQQLQHFSPPQQEQQQRQQRANSNNNQQSNGSPAQQHDQQQQDEQHHGSIMTSVVSVANSILVQLWPSPWSCERFTTPIPVLASLQALVESIPDHSVEPLLGAAVQSLVSHLVDKRMTLLSSSTGGAAESTGSSGDGASKHTVAPPAAAQMAIAPAALCLQLLWAGLDNHWLVPSKLVHLPRLTHALLSAAFLRGTTPLLGPLSSDLLNSSVAHTAALTLLTKSMPSSVVFEYSVRLMCASPLSTLLGHDTSPSSSSSSSSSSLLERCRNRIAIAIASVPSALLLPPSSTSNNSSKATTTAATPSTAACMTLSQKQQRIVFLLSLIASEPARAAQSALCASFDLLLTRLLATSSSSSVPSAGESSSTDPLCIVESFKDILRLRPSRIAAVAASAAAAAASAPAQDDQAYRGGGDGGGGGGEHNDDDDDGGGARRRRRDDNGRGGGGGGGGGAVGGGSSSNSKNGGGDGGGGDGALSSAAMLEKLCPGVAEWSSKLAILRSVKQTILTHSSDRAWYGLGAADAASASGGSSASRSSSSVVAPPMLRAIADCVDTLLGAVVTNSTCSYFVVPLLHLIFSSRQKQQQTMALFVPELPLKLLIDSPFTISAALRKVIEDGPAASRQLRQLLQSLLPYAARNKMNTENTNNNNNNINSAAAAAATTTLLNRIATPIGVWVGECWNAAFCCHQTNLHEAGGHASFFQHNSGSSSSSGRRPQRQHAADVIGSPGSSPMSPAHLVYVPQREAEKVAVDAVFCVLSLCSVSRLLMQSSSSSSSSATSGTGSSSSSSSHATAIDQAVAALQVTLNTQFGLWDSVSESLIKDLFWAPQQEHNNQQQSPTSASRRRSNRNNNNNNAHGGGDDDDDGDDDESRSSSGSDDSDDDDDLDDAGGLQQQRQQQRLQLQPRHEYDDEEGETVDPTVKSLRAHLLRCRRDEACADDHTWPLDTLLCFACEFLDVMRRALGPESHMSRSITTLWMSLVSQVIAGETALLTAHASTTAATGAGAEQRQLSSSSSNSVLARSGEVLRGVVVPGQLRPDASLCLHLSDMLLQAVSSRAATWSMQQQEQSPALLRLCLTTCWLMEARSSINGILMVLRAAAAAASTTAVLDENSVRHTFHILQRNSGEVLKKAAAAAATTARRKKQATGTAAVGVVSGGSSTTTAADDVNAALCQCLIHLSRLSSLGTITSVWLSDAARFIETMHLTCVIDPALISAIERRNSSGAGGDCAPAATSAHLLPLRLALIAACARSGATELLGLNCAEFAASFFDLLLCAHHQRSSPSNNNIVAVLSGVDFADRLAQLFSDTIFASSASSGVESPSLSSSDATRSDNNSCIVERKKLALLRNIIAAFVRVAVEKQQQQQQHYLPAAVRNWITRLVIRLLLAFLHSAAHLASSSAAAAQQQEQQLDKGPASATSVPSSSSSSSSCSFQECLAGYLCVVAALIQMVVVGPRGDDGATGDDGDGLAVLRNAFNFAVQNHTDAVRELMATGGVSASTVQVLRNAMAPPPAAQQQQQEQEQAQQVRAEQPELAAAAEEGGGLRSNLSSWT